MPNEFDGFRSLQIEDWRQFEDISIEFHPRLTILTGANASGKSTLLGILARHFNWARPYSSAPVRAKGEDGQWQNLGRRRARSMSRSPGWAKVGELKYQNGAATEISVPVSVTAGRQHYDLLMPDQQGLLGLYLSSHRSAFGSYANVTSIPTLFASAEQLLATYSNEIRTHWAGEYSQTTPQMALKQALIAAAVFGQGGGAVEYNDEAHRIWSDFQTVLGLLLPSNLGFRRLRVRVPDVILETATGDFILDESSGGLTAVIELAWQIYLRSRATPSFSVVMDEPENHLHPSLQRELLPRLLEAFPSVQFIVATHSPFVVTATPDSSVFVLDYDSRRRVFSRRLDYARKSASAEETLTRVLGMPTTAPIWAEKSFDEIVNRHLKGSMTAESLRALREELTASGLSDEFPAAMTTVVDGKSQA